jgi:hypothetical protein
MIASGSVRHASGDIFLISTTALVLPLASCLLLGGSIDEVYFNIEGLSLRLSGGQIPSKNSKAVMIVFSVLGII